MKSSTLPVTTTNNRDLNGYEITPTKSFANFGLDK